MLHDPHARPTCLCDGCNEPAATFEHYPTVVGHCIAHGGAIADFITLVDLPANVAVSFDAVRLRWERRLNRLGAR